MNEPPRFFFPASRAHHAFAMAIDFGMRFKKRNGFWTPEGLLGITGGGGYRIEVAGESIHLLQPRQGDLIRWHNPTAWDSHVHRFSLLYNDEPIHADNRLLEIIQRNGLPFHYPEQEP